MHLTDFFAASLSGRRDAVGLEYEDPEGGRHQLTFGQLDTRAGRLAHVLAGRGVAAGDRLCVLLSNRVENLDLLLACARIGAILVPVNILYRERELAHIIGDADPVAVVVSGQADALFPSGTALWDIDQLSRESAATPGTAAPVALDGDAPAMLVYTSGTTGRSKGAVLTHNNLMANAMTLASCWQITATDRFLCALPLFHVHGLGNGVMTWLLTGCRMRLVERFDITRAERWFTEFSPTLFFGVPTIYVRLLELPETTARSIGGGMRLFVSGSAPLPAAVLDAFRDRFGHVILERYGMSETLMICGNPLFGERRPGAVGPPFPGVSIRITDGDGEPCPDGVVGEVRVRGPAVCRGYWRRGDADAEAFVDGWFRTGDLGERSPDGYVTLRGRRTDLIISGGYNIYPREIEDVLLEQPGVREAAVVGVPDEARGEVPVAYIAGDHLPDSVALEAACRRQLASFKVPRGFLALESLPRTALGKIQKHLLPPWK